MNTDWLRLFLRPFCDEDLRMKMNLNAQLISLFLRGAMFQQNPQGAGTIFKIK